MAQYMLSVWTVQGEPAPDEDAMATVYRDVDRLNEQIKAEGAWVFAGGLHPADTAGVVRIDDDGEASIDDGPFADNREQLGGFWVVELADLDAARSLAARAAVACGGPVEVRAFQSEPGADADVTS